MVSLWPFITRLPSHSVVMQLIVMVHVTPKIPFSVTAEYNNLPIPFICHKILEARVLFYHKWHIGIMGAFL